MDEEYEQGAPAILADFDDSKANETYYQARAAFVLTLGTLRLPGLATSAEDLLLLRPLRQQPANPISCLKTSFALSRALLSDACRERVKQLMGAIKQSLQKDDHGRTTVAMEWLTSIAKSADDGGAGADALAVAE